MSNWLLSVLIVFVGVEVAQTVLIVWCLDRVHFLELDVRELEER